MVEPPGCRAQSKSLGGGGGASDEVKFGNDWTRDSNAGATAAEAKEGTLGVRTTFQPALDVSKTR